VATVSGAELVGAVPQKHHPCLHNKTPFTPDAVTSNVDGFAFRIELGRGIQ
jgi:hypothetical protein